jgi:hypothetical protein
MDMQGMTVAEAPNGGGGGGGNSSLSLLCHSSHSITICL